MKIHIVSGTHPIVPGMHQSAHIDQAAAEKEAMRLLAMVAASLDDPIAPPEDASIWRDFQRGVQTARIMELGGEDTDVDDDYLSSQAGFRVEIAVLDAPNPRMVIEMDGGLIEKVSGDVDVDVIVVDYDIEGAADEDVVDVVFGDMTKAAYISTQGRENKDDSAWIDLVEKTRDEHDALSTDES